MSVTYESIWCEKCNVEMEKKDGVISCPECKKTAQLEVFIGSRMICKCSGKDTRMEKKDVYNPSTETEFTCPLCGYTIRVIWN